MIYVISDLHGYSMDKFLMLLAKANFSNLGNHEEMLLACDFMFDEITEEL